MAGNAVQNGNQLTMQLNNGFGSNIRVTGTISGNIFSGSWTGTIQAWEGMKTGPIQMEIGKDLNEMGGYMTFQNSKWRWLILLKRGHR